MKIKGDYKSFNVRNNTGLKFIFHNFQYHTIIMYMIQLHKVKEILNLHKSGYLAYQEDSNGMLSSEQEYNFS